MERGGNDPNRIYCVDQGRSMRQTETCLSKVPASLLQSERLGLEEVFTVLLLIPSTLGPLPSSFPQMTTRLLGKHSKKKSML